MTIGLAISVAIQSVGALADLLARLGDIQLFGIGFTRASWAAYMNMYGVMMPRVSAGSNQVGEIVI